MARRLGDGIDLFLQTCDGLVLEDDRRAKTLALRKVINQMSPKERTSAKWIAMIVQSIVGMNMSVERVSDGDVVVVRRGSLPSSKKVDRSNDTPAMTAFASRELRTAEQRDMFREFTWEMVQDVRQDRLTSDLKNLFGTFCKKYGSDRVRAFLTLLATSPSLSQDKLGRVRLTSSMGELFLTGGKGVGQRMWLKEHEHLLYESPQEGVKNVYKLGKSIHSKLPKEAQWIFVCLQFVLGIALLVAFWVILKGGFYNNFWRSMMIVSLILGLAIFWRMFVPYSFDWRA